MQSFTLPQLSSCHVPGTVPGIVPGVGDAVVSKGAVIPALIISVVSNASEKCKKPWYFVIGDLT